ncbi:MFS transporter [uncultured Dialister sp.]|jgi:predicted MFS family arabinose efflux permease|uniref:MFS transporter n=1 Tax=uncultured Dialister sp. TaxID=278064 RepID=UPI0025D17843|nr:MFS transporter [uncultured Dialister sp.]
MAQAKIWTREFLGMGMTNFFYFMSQYILIASLPVFIMDDLGKGQWEAGMAMTCFQIGTVVCRPLAGRIIDGVNKQRLLLVASSVFFLVMGSFYFVSNLQMVWGLRLVHGIVFALGTTASATMAALVLPKSRKGEGIGYFAVSGNLAMVIGPLVGLLIIDFLGPRPLFIFLALLALGAIYGGNGKKLPDDIILPSGKRKQGFHVADFFEKKALPSVILGGLVFFAYGGVLTFIPMYTRSLGLSSFTSLFFLVFALVIVVTRPFVGYLFDHHGPDATVYLGFAFFCLGFVLFSQVGGVPLLLLSAGVLGIGFGALAPAFQTLAVQSAPPSRAGVATSTYFWSLDISVGLAAAVLGVVSDSLGYPFMYGVVCLASAVLGLVYYFFWRRSGKRAAA